MHAAVALQRRAGNAAVAGLLRPLPVRLSLAAPAPRTAEATDLGHATVQRFEAGHHERTEKAALTAPGQGTGGSFTEAEAGAAYFGNWSRDLSQVFSNNAVVKALGQEFLFEVLNVLAMQKFGKEIKAADFGVYSARQHIDNPAGQMTGELMQNTNPNGPLLQTGKDQFTTPKEDISSPEAISSSSP